MKLSYISLFLLICLCFLNSNAKLVRRSITVDEIKDYENIKIDMKKVKPPPIELDIDMDNLEEIIKENEERKKQEKSGVESEEKED
ncbi:hypothetical protein BCR32DRAFT_296389 [Anaeromyces robustus]|uniref:Uncharacterized protein n=1 Tax=Anaeromyces robustus TaxID=1754192 RepID=A0A1Y1WRN1_9FUNG|nr:hypothetical protein BCR32DRAFT_296389 [Anaeromyces robustus]|eukprot:ORX76199.1 hypothetical protein BCR32DRAFT_296389 [Anaeromyces robustus]